MNDVISFTPVFPLSITLVILLVLALLFIAIERKKNQRFKAMHISALVLMLLALVGILTKPHLSYKTTSSAILLTQGYDPKQVDSLTAKLSHPVIYHLPNVKPYKKSKALLSSHALTAINNRLRYVLGTGIPPAMLDALDHTNYVFIASNINNDVTQLTLSDPVIINRTNTIHGVLNDSSITKIKLEGPGGKEDSVIMKHQSQKTFALSFLPKQQGNFLYTLAMENNQGNTITNVIPVHVQAEQSFKILFIQHFPTFETQYLKKFLAKDHSLVFRNQLSRNIFRYEYVNHNNVEISKLTNKLLNQFDLLFIDTDSFKELSPGEVNVLKQSLQEGLGVIILFNESPDKILALKNLLPEFSKTKADTATFKLASSRRITLPVWPVSPTHTASLLPVTTSDARIFSGYSYHGFGRIGFQLLQETYRTTLEGDSATYSLLWTDLLGKVGRRKTENFKVVMKSPQPYYEDEPIHFDVIATERPDVLIDNITVPLTEDLYLDNVWHGKTWAGPTGWHEMHIANDSTRTPFYVHTKGSWQSLHAVNTMQANKIISSQSVEDGTTEERKPVSPLFFFLIFLISTGFLWFAPKL